MVDASALKSVGRETSRAGATPAVGTKSVVAKGRAFQGFHAEILEESG